MTIEASLYKSEKTIYEISEIIGISPVAVWKRLKKQGIKMRSPGPKDRPWGIKKRGIEYLGSDGRYWIRGKNPHNHKKRAKRRAIVILEDKLERKIKKGHLVHHKNGDERDDRPENLEEIKYSEHNRIHHYGVKNLKKGRNRDNHHKTIVNSQKVKELIKLRKEEKYSQQKLGNIFGIHQTTVSSILRSNY